MNRANEVRPIFRSLLFIGKLKDSPTTRVLIHEKSSLAPPGQSLAFSLGDEKGLSLLHICIFMCFAPSAPSSRTANGD